MGFDLTNFQDDTLDADYLAYLTEQEAHDARIHFARLWEYFRNPIAPAAGIAADALNENSRPYFQSQELGLPARITGISRTGIGGERLTDRRRKEVVIENDIAWRVHAMVDFLFGKPVSIRSLARDRALAAAVETAVKALFDANGGQSFFQELALLGAVYGFVDVVPRTSPAWPNRDPQAAELGGLGSPPAPASSPLPAPADRTGDETDRPAAGADAARPGLPSPAAVERAAGGIALETIEATRVLPILGEDDCRTIRYWVQCFRKQTAEVDRRSRTFLSFGWGGRRDLLPRTIEVVEILGPRWWQRYEDGELTAEGANPLDRVPVVHIQNVAQPGGYEGFSDVEPLIPLQDELNTRLSDRASRVTFQSFKMYLGKGIEGFLERPVGPGQMWATHNLDATVQEFGSDTGSPSETVHIEHVRQAMDKVSGVTGLAAGLVRGNVGHLTSATALRVLLSGILSRTERKRLTYGRGIERIVELALDLLDRAGVLRTSPSDRRVEIHWPSPLPEDETQRLANAQAKLAVGVPAGRVLAELGYQRDQVDPAGTQE